MAKKLKTINCTKTLLTILYSYFYKMGRKMLVGINVKCCSVHQKLSGTLKQVE